MSTPSRTDHPGWPDFIQDPDDVVYVRLRDGSPFPVGPVGSPCLYGKLDDDGYIDRDRQWIPNLDSLHDGDEDRTLMNPSSWTTAEELIAQDLPPIEEPEEPVEVPREFR